MQVAFKTQSIHFCGSSGDFSSTDKMFCAEAFWSGSLSVIVGWTAGFDMQGFNSNFGINKRADFAFCAMLYLPLMSTICCVSDLLF